MLKLTTGPKEMRAVAALLLLFAAVCFGMSIGSPPPAAKLARVNGAPAYVEKVTGKGNSTIEVRFGLHADPAHFRYTRKAGDCDAVLDALQGAANMAVAVAYEAGGSASPITVYELKVGSRTIRSYEEVAASWRNENQWGRRWGAGLLAASVLLLLLSLLRRNAS